MSLYLPIATTSVALEVLSGWQGSKVKLRAHIVASRDEVEYDEFQHS